MQCVERRGADIDVESNNNTSNSEKPLHIKEKQHINLPRVTLMKFYLSYNLYEPRAKHQLYVISWRHNVNAIGFSQLTLTHN